jgi:hypothetical protein
MHTNHKIRNILLFIDSDLDLFSLQSFQLISVMSLLKSIQGYSPEISDENFVICNPKYKKPLELDILFNSK